MSQPQISFKKATSSAIKISAAAVVDMIRKIDNWSAEDDALVYDVGAAYKPSQKCGWTAKRMKEKANAVALVGNPVADAGEGADE